MYGMVRLGSLVAAVALGVACARTQPMVGVAEPRPDTADASCLGTDESALSLEVLRPGETDTEALLVWNACGGSLEISEIAIEGSGPFAVVDDGPRELESGEEATLEVQFAPEEDGEWEVELALTSTWGSTALAVVGRTLSAEGR